MYKFLNINPKSICRTFGISRRIKIHRILNMPQSWQWQRINVFISKLLKTLLIFLFRYTVSHFFFFPISHFFFLPWPPRAQLKSSFSELLLEAASPYTWLQSWACSLLIKQKIFFIAVLGHWQISIFKQVENEHALKTTFKNPSEKEKYSKN